MRLFVFVGLTLSLALLIGFSTMASSTSNLAPDSQNMILADPTANTSVPPAALANKPNAPLTTPTFVHITGLGYIIDPAKPSTMAMRADPNELSAFAAAYSGPKNPDALMRDMFPGLNTPDANSPTPAIASNSLPATMLDTSRNAGPGAILQV